MFWIILMFSQRLKLEMIKQKVMKMKKLIYGMIGAGCLLVACDQIKEGYMSDNIYYVTDPFIVEQGKTTYSEALEVDNSTGPINVELLDIRNVETGKTEEAWYSESEITFWKEEINSATDTTWEQVAAKYSMRSYPTFQVNPIGGRLEFSEGTLNVPTGEYEIDIKVSNVRDTRIIKNACTIVLTESSSFVQAGTYDLWNSSNSDTRLDPVMTYKELTEEDELEAFKSKLAAAGGEYNEDYGYMILKVLDNYGSAFDWTPNTDANTGGEIRQRQSDLGSFEKRSPWQKMYYTSDAMIAPFPMAPFPLINAPVATDDLSYYRIIPSATTKGVDIWIRFSWFILRKGVFEITYQLKGADDTGIIERVKK